VAQAAQRAQAAQGDQWLLMRLVSENAQLSHQLRAYQSALEAGTAPRPGAQPGMGHPGLGAAGSQPYAGQPAFGGFGTAPPHPGLPAAGFPYGLAPPPALAAYPAGHPAAPPQGPGLVATVLPDGTTKLVPWKKTRRGTRGGRKHRKQSDADGTDRPGPSPAWGAPAPTRGDASRAAPVRGSGVDPAGTREPPLAQLPASEHRADMWHPWGSASATGDWGYVPPPAHGAGRVATSANEAVGAPSAYDDFPPGLFDRLSEELAGMGLVGELGGGAPAAPRPTAPAPEGDAPGPEGDASGGRPADGPSLFQRTPGDPRGPW